jgi:hypothetical protein
MKSNSIFYKLILYHRGMQLSNPFYSIWDSKFTSALAVIVFLVKFYLLT